MLESDFAVVHVHVKQELKGVVCILRMLSLFQMYYFLSAVTPYLENLLCAEFLLHTDLLNALYLFLVGEEEEVC